MKCAWARQRTFLSILSLAPAHLDNTVDGAIISSGRFASAASLPTSVVFPVPAIRR